MAIETSILSSTKKILGIADSYAVFDLDILTHINSAFSTLYQIGIGPLDSFSVDDSSAVWEDLDIPVKQLSLVKTYIYLKVRILFDPPTTSFLIEAQNKQMEELIWRLSSYSEETDWRTYPEEEEVIV